MIIHKVSPHPPCTLPHKMMYTAFLVRFQIGKRAIGFALAICKVTVKDIWLCGSISSPRTTMTSSYRAHTRHLGLVETEVDACEPPPSQAPWSLKEGSLHRLSVASVSGYHVSCRRRLWGVVIRIIVFVVTLSPIPTRRHARASCV